MLLRYWWLPVPHGDFLRFLQSNVNDARAAAESADRRLLVMGRLLRDE